MTRRHTNPALAATVLVAALALTGCGGSSPAASGGEPVDGGELNVAIGLQPPSLDPVVTTAAITLDTSNLMLEPLFAYDKALEVHPMLAESYETEDYQTFTIALREGVMFHNGKEMTADDVVASLERWRDVSNKGTAYFGGTTFAAVDDYTVEMVTPEMIFIAPQLLTGAYIWPAESIAAAGESGVPLDQFYGTGPYMLEEWKQDSYISFTRFADYQPVDGEPDGTAGAKQAHADRMVLDIVTDEQTRLNGVLTGEYDFVYDLSYDNLDQLEGTPGIQFESTNVAYSGFVYNKKEGIASDVNFRQAVNAALDIEAIERATYPEGEYVLNASAAALDSTWHSDAADAAYNQADLDKAKEYLAQSSYNGETVRLLTSQDYPGIYNATVVLEQTLTELGLKVDLIQSDWATMFATRAEPSKWDIFPTFFNYGIPVDQVWILPDWPGWTDSPELTAQIDGVLKATSMEEALAANEELHAQVAEYMPLSIIGSYPALYAWGEDITGFDYLYGPTLYGLARTE